MASIVENGKTFQVVDVKIGSVASRASSSIFVIICILPMITTLLYGGVDAVVLGLQSLAAAAVMILWIRDAWITEGFRFSTNPLQLPIIGLILIGFVQLLPIGDHGVATGLLNVPVASSISLDPFGTRMFTVRLIVYLIFFAAALAFVDSKTRFIRLATLAVIFGSLTGFFGLLQRLANPDAIYGLRPTPQAIPFGPFINQHHFAAFMLMTFALSLGMLLSSGVTRDRKAFLLLACVVSAMGLFFTGSRGGVLSFAGVLFFTIAAAYMMRAPKASTEPARNPALKLSMIAGVIAIVIIVIGSVFYLGGGDSLLRGIGGGQNYVDVSNGRIHFWKTSIEIIKNHPLLGAGLDSFGVTFTRFDTQNGLFRVENAHNEYLQVLAEGGIAGFLCLAAFIYFLLRRGLTNISQTSDSLMQGIATGALAGCIGIAIHSFFDFPLRTPSNALFFLVLAVLATIPFKTNTSRG